MRILPGRLTALACARPTDTATVLDRLARYTPSQATWAGVPLDEIRLPQIREHILLADHEADLFAGPLREVIMGADSDPAAAIHAAVAADIVQGLPDGLDSPMDAQARNLSGGQRQRIRLVRALLADPEVLLAIEPTSALDAHTEALVAKRLHEAREGRTTAVTTTSPSCWTTPTRSSTWSTANSPRPAPISNSSPRNRDTAPWSHETRRS